MPSSIYISLLLIICFAAWPIEGANEQVCDERNYVVGGSYAYHMNTSIGLYASVATFAMDQDRSSHDKEATMNLNIQISFEMECVLYDSNNVMNYFLLNVVDIASDRPELQGSSAKMSLDQAKQKFRDHPFYFSQHCNGTIHSIYYPEGTFGRRKIVQRLTCS